jgi:hypothetical protein
MPQESRSSHGAPGPRLRAAARGSAPAVPALLLLLGAILLPRESQAQFPQAPSPEARSPQSPQPQEAPGAPRSGPLVLEGTLFLAGVPADSGTVVLHRVTPEEAGPVDSVQVDEGGRFRLPLPAPPSPLSGTFFVTHRHDGVAFFGRPLTSLEQVEASYEIRAFPSRPLPAPGTAGPGAGEAGAPSGRFVVSFRNLFIEEGPEGWRVTDVFEVGHADEVTWTSPDPEGGVPVWSHPLPTEARNVQASESDVSVASLRLDRGALEVHAPFPPGDRLFVVRYDLPSLETSIPLLGRTGAVEFLVREPAPAMRVEGLLADAPVELERGSLYRRWWGEDLTDAALRVRLGEEPELPVAWIAVGLAFLLAGMGSWAVMRRSGPPAPVSAPEGTPVPGPRPTRGPGAGQGTGPGAGGGAPAGRPRPRTRRRILLEIAHLEEATAAGELDPETLQVRREALLEEMTRGEGGLARPGSPEEAQAGESR